LTNLEVPTKWTQINRNDLAGHVAARQVRD
jgi:hypothetical protein